MLLRLLSSAPPLTRASPDPPPEAEKAAPRKHRRVKQAAPARTYASSYAGVTVHRGRWLAVWGTKERPIRGKVRELSPRGERWAAQDRARGLEREWLEMRDGTRVEYRWKGEMV